MPLNWKTGGLLLGLVFFAAVLLVKPIGVSTQFVILDGIIGDAVNSDLVTKVEEGWSSTNAYLAKSGGKYAKSVANPWNYSLPPKTKTSSPLELQQLSWNCYPPPRTSGTLGTLRTIRNHRYLRTL